MGMIAMTRTNCVATERLIKVAIPAAVITLLLETGTGGANTLDYYRLREAKLVVRPNRPAASNSDAIDVATAANDLARIKSILKLSTTEIGRAHV
jgi:hypothetical protein